MKNFIKSTIVLSLSVVTLFSCSKNEDEQTTTNPNSVIAGKWKETSVVNIDQAAADFATTQADQICNQNVITEFTLDGKQIVTGTDCHGTVVNHTMNYNIKDNIITIGLPFEFTVSGTTLTIKVYDISNRYFKAIYTKQ